MSRQNIKLLSSILLAILFLGLFPATVFAASPAALVIGNSYTLESGETLNDELFILGGSVDLMVGSTINGNVFLLGGSVQAAGTINGNVTVLGGTLYMASSFVLNGNLNSAGTVINRDPGAQIYGQYNTNENVPYVIIPGQVRIPDLNSNLNPFFRVVGFFFRLFLWALIAMVLAMFFPVHLTRISQTAILQPLISGGMGFLTIIIVPIILVLLAITICLIPVTLLGALLLVIAWVAGLIALGYEVGKRFSAMFKQEWHPAILAGIGTLALMLVLSGLEAIIPCVGWIPKALVGLLGLGAVLLTQFGTKPYTPNHGIAEGTSNIVPS
ncbi:MAG: polymer-forming cytoskeletal protein [Anaerolineales bacterium]